MTGRANFIFKTGAQLFGLCLCLIIVLIAVIAPAVPAGAQSNDIVNRLNRLENELQTLNRAFYRGEKPNDANIYGAPGLTPQPLVGTQAGGDNFLRVQQLEQDLRDLTGRIEEQNFEIRSLRDEIAAMQTALKDMDQKVSGNMAASTPAAPPQLAAGNGGAAVQPSLPGDAGGVPASSIPAIGSEPAQAYEQAYQTLNGGNFAAAQTAFENFLKAYPDHSLSSNATYWLAETFYVRNQYKDAARFFAKAYQDFPNGSKSPDSLLKLALSLEGMEKPEDACIALKQLRDEYPGGPQNVLSRAEEEQIRLDCR